MNDPRPSPTSPSPRARTGKPVPPPPRRRDRSPARRLALDALEAVEDGARANVVVPELLAGSDLEERDRALVTELVYGTTRMRRACDWLVDRHVRGRTDVPVRAALRLGAYQLAWMRVPAHAAVAATVGEVRGPGRSMVNAVLRRVADDVAAGPPRWPDPATALSYPDWIVSRLAADLGSDRARHALETMNLPAAATERSDGYIQDRASQEVAAHVGATGGERILDLCAAPGGKTTAMAGLGEGRPALVVGADQVAARAAVVAGNARRLGLANVAATVADGLRPPWREGSFDRVLVDAPCSGLGVLRRRPDARWRVQAGDITRLAALQQRLVAAALPLLRPGGTLVYSVCTLTLAETAGLDRWAAAQHPRLTPLPRPGGAWTTLGRGALLLPQDEGTDGMYVLTLRA